jgi:hypothetical protein
MVVSTFYTSNVEYYLMREGSFNAFARNVVDLPRNSRSVIIRSVFDNTGYMRPLNVPSAASAFSAQIMGTMDAFVSTFKADEFRSYGDVATKGLIPLVGGNTQPAPR